MSYTKTTWVSGSTPTDAAEMNNIENGVSANDTALNSITGNDGVTQATTNGPFTLANFINYILTALKAIKGSTHWYDAPAASLASLNTSVSSLSANKLDASAYTAADVLAKVKTVDGSGSGLDADTLDGVGSSGYVRATVGLTGSFKAQSTAPASPADGDLWLDTSTVLG